MRPAPAAALLLLLLLLLAALGTAPPPARAVDKVSSQYYVCTVRGDCPEVPELLKVADAAYARFAAYFGKKPGGGKLEIEYFAEASAMGEKMKSDGFPDESFGTEGRFWNYNRRVYARRLDFDWDTRRALIINLVDQFQSLSVQGKNKSCPTWYRAGLAAHFAIHRWDGKTLQVGVDDEPTPWGRELAKFYDSARAKSLDVTDPVRSDAKSYIEAWPFVHWSLSSGDRGAYGRFRAAEKKMWNGESGDDVNPILFGGSDFKKVKEAGQAWFAEQRATWVGKLDLWERTSEDGFRSVPRPNPWSLLLTDADEGDAPFVEAVVAPGAKGTAGVALHAGETGSFVAAVWTPGGSLSLTRYLGPDRPEVLESCPGPEGAEARIRLEADAAGALRVSVAGKQVLAHAPQDPALLGKGKAGLFAADGPARFDEVKCSAVKAKKR